MDKEFVAPHGHCSPQTVLLGTTKDRKHVTAVAAVGVEWDENGTPPADVVPPTDVATAASAAAGVKQDKNVLSPADVATAAIAGGGGGVEQGKNGSSLTDAMEEKVAATRIDSRRVEPHL